MSEHVGTGLVLKKGGSAFGWSIKSLNGPGISVGSSDASHLGLSGWKEKLPETLKDPGELSMEILLSTTAPLSDIGVSTTYRIEYNGGLILSGAGWISKYEPKVDEGTQTASITITFSGAITVPVS